MDTETPDTDTIMGQVLRLMTDKQREDYKNRKKYADKYAEVILQDIVHRFVTCSLGKKRAPILSRKEIEKRIPLLMENSLPSFIRFELY